MRFDVIYSSAAFLALENLPQYIGFGIVALSEHLRSHPELGMIVQIRNAPTGQYRMLIYRGTHRVIYEVDEIDRCVYVGAVQDCRQKLPDGRELKKDLPLDELTARSFIFQAH